MAKRRRVDVTAIPDNRAPIHRTGDANAREPLVLLTGLDGEQIAVNPEDAIALSKAIVKAAAEAHVWEREWETSIG